MAQHIYLPLNDKRTWDKAGDVEAGLACEGLVVGTGEDGTVVGCVDICVVCFSFVNAGVVVVGIDNPGLFFGLTSIRDDRSIGAAGCCMITG